MDFNSIYIFVFYLILLSIKARYKVSNKILLRSLLFFVIIQSILLWYFPFFRIIILVVDIIIFLYLEFIDKSNKNYKFLYTALTVFLISWVLWWLDILYIWDNKDLQHLINGHSSWHIGTALSLYFLYKYKSDQLES
jgi:hypothetical protein